MLRIYYDIEIQLGPLQLIFEPEHDPLLAMVLNQTGMTRFVFELTSSTR